MSDLDRILVDQIASGKITTDDAASIYVFAQFLAETPPGVPGALRKGRDAALACFPDAEAFKAWRTRWLAYAAGLADGPTEPDEYAEILPYLKEMRG
jgi:hypothetical protein